MYPFSQDFYQQKIETFKSLFPKNEKVSCIQYIDWSYDIDESPENYHELIFYEKSNTDFCKGNIYFLRKGSYKYSKNEKIDKFFPQEMLSQNLLIKKSWIYKWIEKENRYEICCCSPESKPFQGCCQIFDFSLAKEEALSYWTYLENEDLKTSLLAETEFILEKKYLTIENVALKRNFKHGWIFHKMKEYCDPVAKIWKKHGYYFLLDDLATKFMYRFKHKHRKELIECFVNDYC